MRKQFLIALCCCAVCLFSGGCGSKTANHLGNTIDANDDVYGSNIYWDGYGINTGYDMDRTTYGTTKEDLDALGYDVKEDLKDLGNDMKNAVNDNPATPTVEDATNTNSAAMVN